MSRISNFTVKMILKSDAIPGSGEGLSGIIDTDITYDEYGLPVIPAKRLKGILLDSAKDIVNYEIISENKMDEIFGTPGMKDSCSLRISNGVLVNYTELKSFLKALENSKKLTRLFNQQSVLDCFTYTRSQTSIENGLAKENTLRINRVLKKGLVFNFDCSIEDEYINDFKTICQITRRFGVNRTRGLGEVSLSVDSKDNQIENQSPNSPPVNNNKLFLKITNIGQLLVSNTVGKNQVSETYIPGATILGSVASKYLREKKAIKDYSVITDELFADLFINGSVSWGNAYPSVNNKNYRPVPLSWKMEKDSEDIYNMTLSYAKIDGFSLKKMPASFISKEGSGFATANTDVRVEYHHKRPEDRRKGSPDKDDGEFYQFEVIQPGQQFIAEINGSVENLSIVEKMIANKTLYIGKSRTAQYGECHCELISCDENQSTDINKDEEFFVVLKSETVLKNENGLSACSLDLVKKELAQLFKVSDEDIEILKDNCFYEIVNIGGYMAVWNMPKIQEPAFKAGSVFTFRYKGLAELKINTLAELNLGCYKERGFGMFDLEDSMVEKPMIKDSDYSKLMEIPEIQLDIFKPLFLNHLRNQLKNQAIVKASEDKSHNLNSSLLRRLLSAVTGSKKGEEITQLINGIPKLKEKEKENNKIIISIKECCSSENSFFDKHIKEIFIESSPDNNLITVTNLLGIHNDNHDSWFEYLQFYLLEYLRALILHQRKSTS